MQFNAQENSRSGEVKLYRWEIVAGEGASLTNADQSRVTFHAPAIAENIRFFNLQLMLEYERGNPSRAQINIRVHKKSPTIQTRRASPWVSGALGFGFGYLWGGWWPYPPLIVIPCPPPDTWWPPEELLPIAAVPLPRDPYYEEWVSIHPDEAELYLGMDELSTQTVPSEEVDPVMREAQPISGIEPEATDRG